MAKQHYVTGIDIGAHAVRTVIGEIVPEEHSVRIIGVGDVSSSGLRRGAITDVSDVAEAIDESLHKAEEMSGIQVKSVYVSIGGADVSVQESKGVVAIGRADGEVTDDDVDRVIAAAQAVTVPANKEVIHIIPNTYNLDNQNDIKDPVGMNGVRLEVDALVVEVPSIHIKNISAVLQKAQLDADEMILSPLATATSVLDKKQKELGVVMIDIGASTTSLAVFEEGNLVHTAVLPVGSGYITSDVAIGLRTTIDIAEKVKIEYGSATFDGIGAGDESDVAQVDSSEEGTVLHRHIIEIIEARLGEIFELVQKELHSVGKDGLLPAGAVITGGGAELPGIVPYAKRALGLPAQIGVPQEITGVMDHVDRPEYATVVGLVLWGVEQETVDGFGSGIIGGAVDGAGGMVRRMRAWFEKFLP